MRTETGFTLIEVLAGGVISTVLAGAMLSLFYMVTGNVKESAANSRLLRIQTVAEDQIRRDARKAFGAKLSSSEPGLIDVVANDGNAYSGLKEIWLIEATPDALVGAYWIHGDTLKEWKNGGFVPMIIGPDTVHLDGANSSFSVFPNRQGVGLDLRYKVNEKGILYTAPPFIDSILCRAQQ